MGDSRRSAAGVESACGCAGGGTFPEDDGSAQAWWSWENGQKAYEMMSCYDGLLGLYALTRNADYLKAAEKSVRNIIDEEINIAGSGSAGECFYHGRRMQDDTGLQHDGDLCDDDLDAIVRTPVGIDS